MKNLNKIKPLIIIALLLLSCSINNSEFRSSWSSTLDGRIIGDEYNPKYPDDWAVANGRLEVAKGDSVSTIRTLEIINRKLGNKPGSLEMSVITGRINSNTEISFDAGTGFLIGAGNNFDLSTNTLINNNQVNTKGLFVGINGLGELFVKDFSQSNILIASDTTSNSNLDNIRLQLSLFTNQDGYKLIIATFNALTNTKTGSLSIENINPSKIEGILGLVSDSGTGEDNRFWYKNWFMAGTKLEIIEK